jgi:hypothetical protein
MILRICSLSLALTSVHHGWFWVAGIGVGVFCWSIDANGWY